MDFSRPAKRDEDAFFNHSLKMLGKMADRPSGKNEEIESAIAEGRAPYDFVPSGKPMKPTRKKKDYSSLHATYADVPPEEVEDLEHTVNASKSLAWAYYYLYHYKSVHFKDQLDDGTWIVEPAAQRVIEVEVEEELDDENSYSEVIQNEDNELELPSRDASLKALEEESDSPKEESGSHDGLVEDEDSKSDIESSPVTESGLSLEVEEMLKNALKKYENR